MNTNLLQFQNFCIHGSWKAKKNYTFKFSPKWLKTKKNPHQMDRFIFKVEKIVHSFVTYFDVANYSVEKQSFV